MAETQRMASGGFRSDARQIRERLASAKIRASVRAWNSIKQVKFKSYKGLESLNFFDLAERDGFEPSVWASTPSASEALPYLASEALPYLANAFADLK